MAITQETLLRLLDYNPDSGEFTWKETRAGNAKASSIAGHNNGRYILIKVCGKSYQAHRLAWIAMTGEFPTRPIDHKDRNPFNNSWSNLRLATMSQNAANRTANRNNKCGFKGVYLNSQGRFSACIKKDGRSRNLGSFHTAVEAHAAYVLAAKELFGEYARAA